MYINRKWRLTIRCDYFPPLRLRGLFNFLICADTGQFHIETNIALAFRKMTLFQKHQLPLSRACLTEEISFPVAVSFQILRCSINNSTTSMNYTALGQNLSLYTQLFSIRVQVGINWSAGKSSQFRGGVNIIIEHPFKQYLLWFDHVAVFCDIPNRPDLRTYELRDVFGPFNRLSKISEGTVQFRLASRHKFRLFEGLQTLAAHVNLLFKVNQTVADPRTLYYV